MKVMVFVKRNFLFWVSALALLLAGCGGGGSDKCILGSALCDSPSAANAAPVARTAPPQNVVLGQTVTLDGTASSDANGDTLSYTWSWVSKPDGSVASLDSSTVAKPSFIVDLPGLYAASLTVRDGQTSSESVLAVVTGIERNEPPVAATGAKQSVVTESVVTLDGSTSSDPNRDRLTYKWSLVSKPEGSTAVLDKPLEVKSTFTADKPGFYAATLVVSDGKLSSETTVVTVQASGLNAAPIAVTSPAQSVLVGAVVQIDGLGSSDPNRDELLYKWSMVTKPTGSSADVLSKDKVRTEFTADVPGVYVVGLTVNDRSLSSDMVAVTITASAANGPPTAVAGPAQNVLKGAVVKLDGSGSSDPNGDPLNYRWAVVSAPVGSSASLNDDKVAKPTFTADVSGVYVLSLIVSDATLKSELSTVTVTASSTNLPPVANAGPEQTVRVGDLVSLSGSGSTDANSDVLTYKWSWTSNPGNAVLSNLNVVSPSFTPTVAGIYVLTLTVSDGKGGTHVARVLINVE
jgi:hypothetical protein